MPKIKTDKEVEEKRDNILIQFLEDRKPEIKKKRNSSLFRGHQGIIPHFFLI